MKTKEVRGITIISLVVTIVVLLILAGVSVSLVIGNNNLPYIKPFLIFFKFTQFLFFSFLFGKKIKNNS